MDVFAALIERLGGTKVVAGRLNVAPPTVSGWKIRRSIPVEHWPGLVALARDAGAVEVTNDALVEMHTTSPSPAANLSEARA